MKRYKLKKDTPAFKAGTECYIEEAGHMVPCRGISYTIVHKDQLEQNPNILDDWFEEIKPAEPLIKDEKIRKAVRAWADVVGEEKFIVSYNMEHHDCCIYTGNLSDTSTIDFGIDLNLKEGSYTIDELCGEKE